MLRSNRKKGKKGKNRRKGRGEDQAELQRPAAYLSLPQKAHRFLSL